MYTLEMAGYIQLLTSGPQEQFFTINPDYSHFITNFKKHSNFSCEYVDIKPENEDTDFGKIVRFNIPQNQGDLLKTLSLKMTLPQLTSPSVYVESVGHALIEYVELVIGNQIVQRVTSDYFQIYSEQNFTQSHQKSLKQLAGKFPERIFATKASTLNAISTLGSTSDVNLFVDIPFYFYRHPELAIPICAICKQEIEVVFKLRNIDKLVVNGIPSIVPHIKDLKLCAEVVFLDHPEKTKLKTTSIDYIITQLQENVFNVSADDLYGEFRLNFVNPVKELFFIIQRTGNSVSVFDYDNDLKFGNGKLILYENLDYLTLQLDNNDILTRETGNVLFLRAVQGAIHHSKTQLIRRFYSYSFALQPEEWYPTGQLNFSHIKDQILRVHLTPSTEPRQVRVYANNFNILRVSEGCARTIFKNTH